MARVCRSVLLLGWCFLLSMVPAWGQTVSFVDETGAPAASYVEGSRVWVRVEDPGAGSPYEIDTVWIIVSSSADSEGFELSETGADTGVYTGSLPLSYQGTGTPGALDTGTSGPPFSRDSLTVSYTTITDTAGLVGSTVQLLDSFGRPTATWLPGGEGRIRVVSPIRNSPYQIDSTTVAVTAAGSGDQESVTLTETGYDTGVFEAELATASQGFASPGDGTLYLPLSDTLQARHDDADGPTFSAAAAASVASLTDFLDTEGKPTSFVMESSRARVQVVDPDADFNPSGPDTTPVQVSSLLTGDSETVELTETGASTGTFQGTVALTLSPGSGQPGNGLLETSQDPGPPHQFDTLTAAHSDAGGGSSATASTFGSRTWFLDAYGGVTAVYAAGTIAYIRVEDQNANNPTQFDRVVVQVLSLTSEDTETLELLEVEKAGGVFEGAILLQNSWSPSGDGRLRAELGERIEARHTDALGATASGAQAHLVHAEIDFIDEEGRPTAELLEKGPARIRVISPARNSDPYTVETVGVDLASLYAGDQELFTLTETGPNSGVFEGTLRLDLSGTSPGDGILQTSNSGGPDYRGDVVTASYGPDIEATAVTASSRVVFIDGFGRETTTFPLGGPVRIRVFDYTAGVPYSIDFLQVHVHVPQNTEGERVTLTETGHDTGVYEGAAPSTEGAGSIADNVLQGQVGMAIEAYRESSSRPYFAVARAAFTGPAVLFVDAAGQPATAYLEGARVYVRVLAPLHNGSSLTVNLATELSGDLETLELQATAPGIFQGSIDTELDSGATGGNGILELSQVQGPPHEFDSVTATYSDTLGHPPSSARAGFTGSRTWFVNAFGTVTESYPIGARVYVRVEDHHQTHPSQFDRLLVQVRSLATGDTETLELLETTKTSNLYEGSLETRDGSVAIGGDGVLQVELMTKIEAERTDPLGWSASKAEALIHYIGIDILDETGRPTTVLLEEGVARVRVVRHSSYDDPSLVDTLGVEVVSRYAGDREFLNLTETGPDTGIYEGTIALSLAATAQNDGLVQTSNSGAPEYRGDEVTASYGPELQATAVTSSSRVVFIDGFGRETTTFPLGGLVRVRVTDYTHGAPYSIDPMGVSLTVPETGDVANPVLLETGYDTGIYEGSILSTDGANSPGDSLLGGQVGAVIEARRDSASRPYPVVALASFTSTSLLFVDVAGQPASVYLEGARAYVRLLAPRVTSGSLTVHLATELSGDLETLELQSTTPGVFEGSIDTELEAGGIGGNGILELSQVQGPPHEFDSVTATYSDTLGNPPSSARVGFTGSRTWFVDAFGAVTDSYPIGGRVHVRVEDHHQTNPSQFDRLLVQVRSLATGDLETLELLETTKTSNIYEGSLETRDYPVAMGGDGVLQVELMTRIEAERTDPLGWSASKAEALIDYIGIDIVDEAGRPTAVLLEEGVARVRVVRHSSYDDPNSADTLGVEVVSRYAGDREFLDLTETGPDTGIYEGSIALSLAATAQNDGLIQTSNSGAPEYRGDEVTASYGPELQAMAVTSSSRVVFIDGFGRETTTFPLGGAVGVRVLDYTAGAPYSIDPLAVTVTVPETGDSESLALLETGFDTGVFEGSLLSVDRSSSSGDGLLQGQVGATIEARRDSSSRPYPVVALASFTGSSLLFVDAAGQPASVYLEGARAYVRLLAPLVTSGSLSVNLATELSGDLETLELQSTRPGVFEGSIDTELEAGGIGGNGILELSQVQGPPHEFDSVTATYSDTLGNPPSSARVGFTGSRTWFIDAYGAVTDSYPMGGQAYVRVEDHHQTNPSQFDRLLVQVRSLATGDLETLELLETTKTSNLYEGFLGTQDYSVAMGGDGVLQVELMTTIEAERTDPLGWSASKAEALIDYIGIDIVDEAGRPTAVLLEEGTARVRVVRHSSYDDPYSADTLGIEVVSRYAGDREFLELTETGPDTGIYEGSIALSLTATAQNDGLVQTSNSGAPAYLGDEVTASYGPELQATAVTSSSRVVFIDGFGRETTTFPLGGAVGVRVFDYTAGAPYSIDPVAVMVTVPETGDSESLALLETGYDTGIFEGSLLSTDSSSSSGDSLLRGQVGAAIEARRESSSRPYPVTAQASFTGTSLLFVDAAGQPASVYLEGARAYVRLLAPLANSGSLSVNLATELSGDLETLELQSTRPGVFEGSIDTELEAGGIGGNGILELSQIQGPPHEFDTLTASYADPLSYSIATARVGFTGSRTWFVDAYGAVTDSYPIGGQARVRVEDHHQTNPLQFDRLLVQVRSLATGDLETLELLETTKTSNLYEGSLGTQDYSVAMGGDGVLQVELMTRIEAERTDPLGWSASKAEALIDYIGIDIVDEAGRPTAMLLEEGTARVRVVRHSSYDDPSSADTLGIEVVSRYAGDREFLELTETGPDTGIYEGSIALSLAATAQNDGLVQTSNSGAPEYLGDEVTASYGPELQATAVTSSSRVVFIDGFGRETTTFPLGGAVGVRVLDYTAGAPYSIDPLEVTVSVPETGDSESLALLETGYDTGIFEGSLLSTDSSSSSGDSLLRGQVGAAIEARRESSSRPYPVTARASFTGTSLLFVDAAGQPASVYLEGARAYVRLLAPLANSSSLTVNLETELSGDLETLELQSTRPGVFEGSIDTQLEAGGIGGNGILELSEVQGPPHEFDTLTASYADPLSYSIATARVGFTGSRTWFIDAYGAVTETYPSGSRVYVRLEEHSHYNHPSVYDRLTVQVRSLSTLDVETIELMETTKTSNVFEGSLDLEEAPSSSGTDGVLQAELGTLIEAERTSLLGWSSSKAQARIAYVGIDIIDEQGRPTAVLLEEGTARVRVVRISQYDDPSILDTMSVEVESRYAGDREFLELTETGPDTGVYEGAIELSLAPFEPNDGTLQTSNSGAPAYLGDEVTATYGPENTATAVTAASRVVFIDGFGRETTSFPLGVPVRVRLVDYAANTPTLIDQTSLTATVPQTGDFQEINLVETGYDTGIFEGAVPSAAGAPAPYDGTLQGQIGATIEAERASIGRPYPVVARATFSGSSLLFVDAAGQPASVYLEGARVYVRALAPLASGPQLLVTLTSELWGDFEELALQETATPGVFEGSIDTESAINMTSGNGVLEVGVNEGPPHEFDTVLVSYDDAQGDGVTTARAAFLGSRVWFVDAYGAVTDSYPSGARVFVRVEDHRQTNPSQLDRLLVQVRSLGTGGDLETLELVETTKTSNVYQGFLEHRDGPVAQGDGVLQAGMGTLIEAEREDPSGWSSSKTQARIDYAGVDFIDEQGLPTAVVLEGGTARVRVVRISDYDDPSQLDTLGVDLTSRYTGDQEILTLTETGVDTGIYEGAIALSLGAFEPNNGTLETSNSGAPAYLGDELTASYGPEHTATAVTVTSRVSFIDGFGREVTTFPLGSTVRVRVVELTTGNPAANDFLEVILQTEGGDTEPLALEETGPDTHVFEGPMETVQGEAYSGDGTLQGSVGQLFVAQRTSLNRPYPVEAHATFTGASLLFVDAAGQPASLYLEGARVYLRLVAPLAGLPDVSVNLTAELTGDSESVLLNPTSPGVYEGSIDTVISAGGIFGNGVLELGEISGPPHEFDTLTASFVYGGTSATASAGLTGSRIWFIDAYGAVTDSYPVGSTAYVRVEDHNVDDPTQVDRLLVTVLAADTEELELIETGPATHIFEGSIPLANSSSGNPGDGRLAAAPGTNIFAQRTDVLGYSTSQAEAGITYGSLDIIDEAGVPTLELLENGIARVRLFSVNDNNDPATAETVVVDVRSLYTGDQEALTLTETGADSAVFEGTIQLSTAGSIPGNDTLETGNSGAPAYLGDEVTASYGPELTAVARTVPARISFLDLLDREVTVYAAVRMPVRVRIEDHSRNTSAEADYFSVPIHSPETSDAETLTLTETGPATGVFEGEIPTTEDPSQYGNGFLYVVQSAELMHLLPYGPAQVARVTFLANLSPFAGNDITEVVEGQSVVVPVLANDSDAFDQTFTVVAVRQGDHGTAVINPDDTVTYTAALGYDGPDSFTYVVEDNLGGQALGTVLVNILSANGPPTPSYDQVVTAEDTQVIIQPLLNDTDPDDDPLDILAVSVPASGTAVLNADDTVTYTPAPEFSGEVVFSYMVSDPSGAEASSAVTVTVTPVNDAPVANDDAATTTEDQPVSVNVVTNDGDIDSATWLIDSVTQGQQGTVVPNPAEGTVVYTPTAEFTGTDIFTYTLRDDAGATDTATVTIIIEPVDDAPVAVSDSVTVAENDPATAINVLANDIDPDGGAMSIASVTQPANGTVVITGGGTDLTYQPNAGYCNTPPGTTLDTFTYTLTPGGSTATVTVAVTCVDNDPVAVADAATVVEDSAANAIDVLANDSDPDSGPISIASVTQPANGTVVITGGGTGLTYQPNASYCSTPPGTTLDTFTYTLTPGGSTSTVTVTVTCVDNDPTAVADATTVAEDSGANTIDVRANDSDPDSGPISIASVTQPANGTVVITGGGAGLTYQPNAGYCNTPPGTALDTFIYTLTPGGSAATVTVSVTCDDDSPVAVADTAMVAEDASATAINVLTNDTDADGGPKSIASVTQPANGTVVITGGGTGLTYQPNAGYCNTPPGTALDTFTYTLTPGGSAATVTVTVTCVNDAPVAMDDAAAVAEDGSVIIPVKGNDSDPESDPLDVTAVTQGANGAVVLNADDTVTYTPSANFSGTDTFTYTLSDGNGGTDIAAVVVTVIPVNDPPVAMNDAAATLEDQPVTVSVRSNDSDLDNNTLTIISVTQGTQGTVTINAGQTVIYTPAANTSGADSFTYTISDGNGGTATASVSVTVAPVNDAPVAVDNTVTTAWNQAVTIPVLVNDVDVDGPSLTVTAVTSSPYGSVVINGGQTITFTPNVQFVGLATFNYTVSDGVGGTATAQVRVTVNKPGRVASNLQVLYDFNEGAGNQVYDVSGVGTALNLTIANTANVTWVTGGLKINTATTIQSAVDANKVINAVQSTNTITVEAWVAPTNLTQSGPARVLSIAQNSSKRDVLLGQDTNKWSAALRTTTTGNSGGSIATPAGGAASGLNHVVLTRDIAGNVTLYVSGTVAASGSMGGNLGNWQGYKLGVGNEIGGGAAWLGELHLMAVYNRALTATEVTQNLLAGAN